jgi:hypothetical protein
VDGRDLDDGCADGKREVAEIFALSDKNPPVWKKRREAQDDLEVKSEGEGKFYPVCMGPIVSNLAATGLQVTNPESLG